MNILHFTTDDFEDPPPLGKLLMITEVEIDLLKDNQIENNKSSIKNIINKRNKKNVIAKKSNISLQEEKNNLIVKNDNNDYEFRDLRNNSEDHSIGVDTSSTLSSKSILSSKKEILKNIKLSEKDLDKKEMRRLRVELNNKSLMIKGIKNNRDNDKDLMGQGNKSGIFIFLFIFNYFLRTSR